VIKEIVLRIDQDGFKTKQGKTIDWEEIVLKKETKRRKESCERIIIGKDMERKQNIEEAYSRKKKVV
jgi:hypothetical protein